MVDLVVELIINKLGINPELVLKKKIRGLNGFTSRELISALISTPSVVEAGKVLGYSDNPIKQAIRSLLLPLPEFSNRGVGGIGIGGSTSPSWRYSLLSVIEYKYCNKCDNTKPYSEFHNNKNNFHGIESECAACKNFRNTLDKQFISLRTPPWSELLEISDFYANCPKGFHVDHEIPLRGKNVSGLHVLSNLKYLLAADNLSKGNRYIISI